jgi:hypothetical protein
MQGADGMLVTDEAQEIQDSVGMGAESETEDGFIIKKFGECWEISGYKGSEKNLVIPREIYDREVIAIGNDAFYSKDLTGLSIPDTVTSIGDDAFGRNNFKELVIPASVVSLGSNAFADCKIVKLSFEDGSGEAVKEIGERAFQYNQITSISFGNTIKVIKDGAFRENKLSGTITIPQGVSVIGGNAFADNSLELAIVPDSNIELHDTAFGKAKKIKASQHALETGETNYTKSENFEWRKTKDGQGIVIRKYNGKDTELNIPPLIDGLPVVELEQIRIPTVTSLTMPDSVTTINSTNLFTDNANLESAKIGSGITSIRNAMFKGCKKLKSITIPDNIITIEPYAFENCGLESVNLGNNVRFIEKNAFANNNLLELSIPEGAVSIAEGAFTGNNLSQVTLPDSITYIGEDAFSKNKIKSVTIPKGVTYIAKNAFSENKLTSVILHDEITTIEDRAFKKNQIKAIDLPESLKCIHREAFMENKIGSLVLPDRLSSLGNEAFVKNELTNLVIGKGLTKIVGAFTSNKLTTLIIPPNIRSILDWAFQKNLLTDVSFPEGIFVDYETFRDNKLTKVTRPKDATFSGPYNHNDPYVPPSNGPFDMEVQIIRLDRDKDREEVSLEKGLRQREVVQYIPQRDYLRQLDVAMNLSISPKSDAPRKEKSTTTPRKEDIWAGYVDFRGAEVHPTGKKLWERHYEHNELGFATVIEWKDRAAAKEAEASFHADSAMKCVRRGRTTAHLSGKDTKGFQPFLRADLMMDMPKDAVINSYREKNLFTVTEVTPAGNWLWELFAEDDEDMVVIIGWENMADANIAEKTYKSKPELTYLRRGNVTAYTRRSGYAGGGSGALTRLRMAAYALSV